MPPVRLVAYAAPDGTGVLVVVRRGWHRMARVAQQLGQVAFLWPLDAGSSDFERASVRQRLYGRILSGRVARDPMPTCPLRRPCA